MFYFLLLTILIKIVTADDSNIVGGFPVPITRHPYQARLHTVMGSFWCGASVLTKFHALTAAHCILKSREPLALHTGSSFLSQPGAVYRVTRNATFGPSKDSDVGVIRVAGPIVFGPACRPISITPVTGEPKAGTMAVATGWGFTRGNSNELRAINIPIISREVCNRLYTGSPVGSITLGEICAGNLNGGVDACQGDSGGALVVNGKQVGIISMGLGCARRNRPGVYSNIAYYSGWISQQIAK